ncbi:MAG TPA: serine hydrolase domain-containing protein [Terriglobales bacterium]|nr:serine hydrolase domain-containing protein [Terriglobales bacterium]
MISAECRRPRRLLRHPGLAIVVSLIVAVSLSACGGSTPKETLPVFYPGDTVIPVSGPDVSGVQAFDKGVTVLLKKWNIPGATVAVAKHGRLILARGYGYADFEAKQLMQPDFMMRIGSNSKVLTSMAILHLKEQGLIDLDTKFLDILTQYQLRPGGDPNIRNITIRDLLRHSGGWDRDKTGDPMGWQGPISRALDISMPVLCPDVIRYMMGQPLDFVPGTKQVYSNLGYCILGRVIEKVSGQPYELYVRNHVLSSMNVRAMSIGYSHKLSERGRYEVKYYTYNGAPLWDSVFPGEGKVPANYGGFEILTLDACGGWIGSAIDLTRVMTAIDGSRIPPFLSAETMTEYTADPGLPDWNTDPHHWYGLGIFVGPDPQTWSHGGGISGTISQLERDSNGYTWSIMTNSESKEPAQLAADQNTTMKQALGSGLDGSPTDLYLHYVSPSLPPRTK